MGQWPDDVPTSLRNGGRSLLREGDLQFRTTLNGITKGNATIQFETNYDTMEV